MTLREAAERVVETCSDLVTGWQSLAPLSVRRSATESLDALRAALAEPQQEPVAWGMYTGDLILDCICPEAHAQHAGKYTVPLYLHPAPTYTPLSDEQLRECFCATNVSCFCATNESEPLPEGWPGLERFARAIEDEVLRRMGR